MVNVGTCIDKAMTKIIGSPPRESMVTWFNEVVKDVTNQPRTWHFLSLPVTVPVAASQLTLPAELADFTAIQLGYVFYYAKHLLSDEEAANGGEGYTRQGDVITFYPATVETEAKVTGEASISDDYADMSTTIFPPEFESLFVIGLRMHYYDVNKDGRFSKEALLYQMEMNKCKAWDNKRKPLPGYERQGYVRQ